MNFEYSQLLKQLLSVNKHGGMKLDLNNCLKLDNLLGNPSQAFPSIHVAGSNGKGSVVTKIAAAFQSSGKRVGLYTSPHISCFRERIRINSQMISEEEMIKSLHPLFTLIKKHSIPATFFEIATMMAFSYFANANIDVAVIETGLGGRLDATNIVKSKLSVITSISLEHTEILGKTLEEIAYEKAGIIKSQIPVVIGPRVPLKIIKGVADQNSSPCVVVSGNFPDFLAENEAIAKQSMNFLDLDPKFIEAGVQALPPCRLEIIYPEKCSCDLFKKPYPLAIVLDVAHNPDGIDHLLKAIEKRFPKIPKRLVLGLSKTKDLVGCLNLLKTSTSYFHLVEAENGRAAEKKVLLETLMNIGVSPHLISCEETIAMGVKNAIVEGGKNQELVVICGTFFIMAAARAVLGIDEPQDPQDMNER
jgi:dihydrofolate synthase / folylpolyglutamate synthase